MSFFKDFKADFTQAMDELMPAGNEMYDDDDFEEEDIVDEPVKEVPEKKVRKKKTAEKKMPKKPAGAGKSGKESTAPEKEPDDLLDLAPEDMEDQIDRLLDRELYEDEGTEAFVPDDDMEVNTLDMSVEDMLNQLAGKKKAADKKPEPAVQENLSVEELLNQLDHTDADAVSDTANEEHTDMGLEALLDSFSKKTTTDKNVTKVPEEIKATEKTTQTKAEIPTEKPIQKEEAAQTVAPVQAEASEKAVQEEVSEQFIPEETSENTDMTEPVATEEESMPETVQIAEPEVTAAQITEPEVAVTQAVEPEVEAEPITEQVAEPEQITEPEEMIAQNTEPEVETEPIKESVAEPEPIAEPEVAAAQVEKQESEKIEEPEVETEKIPELIAVPEQIVEPEVAVAQSTEPEVPEEQSEEPIEKEDLHETEEVWQAAEPVKDIIEQEAEDETMSQENDIISIHAKEETTAVEDVAETGYDPDSIDTETTYITKGTKITGDLETDGSIDIIGRIEGNVNCKGKVVVGGQVTGDITAGELYANNARIEGSIKSYGSVKVGVGSMIIGGIEGESAVIAGAVNGDIDVKGPVIVDSTAVIMGNIKSRSVQINNGAVIEGFCSQSYSDIDVKSFFA